MPKWIFQKTSTDQQGVSESILCKNKTGSKSLSLIVPTDIFDQLLKLLKDINISLLSESILRKKNPV